MHLTFFLDSENQTEVVSWNSIDACGCHVIAICEHEGHDVTAH